VPPPVNPLRGFPSLRSVTERRRRIAGFLFRLETEDGAPAEPRQLTSAVPNWGAGDTIHPGKRTLRVIAKRDDEPTAGKADLYPTSAENAWLRSTMFQRHLGWKFEASQK
jgi:hypothetical protein